jgi:heme-degrading monooxygenase HmoA
MSLPMADNERGVFVAISDIELKKESMPEFKKWFSESNTIVSKFDGFMSRRLLE